MKFAAPQSSRFCGIFLLIFTVFSIMIMKTVPVKAAGSVTLSLDKTIVSASGTTNVIVKAQGIPAPGLAGYDFKINYDPSALSLVGLAKTSDFAAPTTEFSGVDQNPSKVPGEILVNAAQYNGTTGDISLFVLSFKAISSTPQTVPITLTVKDLADSDLADIPYTVDNGSVTVVGSTAPSISVSPATLSESSANDGSLSSGDVTLTLANSTFASDIGKQDISIIGLPAGMDYTVIRESDTTLKVSITGKAIDNDNSNDTTLTLTVAQAKVNGTLTDLSGTIGLDFMNNSTEKSISSVAAIGDINVPNGTALESIGLPNSCQVTLNDTSTQTVNITWNEGNPSYNPTTAGTYTFTGTLTNLPAGIVNTNNLTAAIKVIVASSLPSGTPFKITIGKKLGRSDKVSQVVIPISIDKSGVTQYSFDLTYDPAKVQAIDVNGTGINSASVPQTTTIGTSANTGTVHFTWNGTATTASGKLFNVVFNVSSALVKTDSDVTINILNSNFTINGSPSNNASVDCGFIRYGMFGDIDNNGSINNLDIGLAKQAYSKTKTLTSNQIMAADVTGDSNVNNLDIGALKQRYSGTLAKFKVE